MHEDWSAQATRTQSYGSPTMYHAMLFFTDSNADGDTGQPAADEFLRGGAGMFEAEITAAFNAWLDQFRDGFPGSFGQDDMEAAFRAGCQHKQLAPPIVELSPGVFMEATAADPE